MNAHKINFAGMLVAATLLASCGGAPGVSEGGSFHDVAPSGWAYGDSFEFTPSPLPDSCMADARIAVAVRHTNAYAYSNLWLELTTPSETGDTLRTDTIDVAMADVYGRWLGRGGGVSYIVTDTLPGRYIYNPLKAAKLRHVMRVDTVRDLEQIGIIYFDIQPLRLIQQPQDTPLDTIAPTEQS